MSKKLSKTITTNKIINILKNHKDEIHRYGVIKIGLFGSFAKGSSNKRSDLDFLVEFEEPSFDNYMNLINYLEKLFGRKVDVLTPGGVDSIRIKSVADSIRRSVIYV